MCTSLFLPFFSCFLIGCIHPFCLPIHVGISELSWPLSQFYMHFLGLLSNNSTYTFYRKDSQACILSWAPDLNFQLCCLLSQATIFKLDHPESPRKSIPSPLSFLLRVGSRMGSISPPTLLICLFGGTFYIWPFSAKGRPINKNLTYTYHMWASVLSPSEGCQKDGCSSLRLSQHSGDVTIGWHGSKEFATCYAMLFMLIGHLTLYQVLWIFTLLMQIVLHQSRLGESYVTCVFSLIVIDDATKEVVYRDYIDISVAVATPRVCWTRRWGASSHLICMKKQTLGADHFFSSIFLEGS